MEYADYGDSLEQGHSLPKPTLEFSASLYNDICFAFVSTLAMAISLEIEGHWDIVITSLQDICNANSLLLLGPMFDSANLASMSEEEKARLKEEVGDHRANIAAAKRLIDTSQENLAMIIDQLGTTAEKEEEEAAVLPPGEELVPQTPRQLARALKNAGSVAKPKRKVGRLYYTSKFNPLEPIVEGLEVAFRLRNRHMEEWIQCEVMRVTAEGTKFEIRDPEPDENNNPGQTFKVSNKEILLIPPLSEAKGLTNYPSGTRVLARYPETTTFYTAMVVGNRKDVVRLKFDGEEEVNKETEVDRRHVLPMPEK